MKNYIGVKIVKAAPMTKGEFNRRKGAVPPLLEQDDEEGYVVKYPDGYVSWSPKKVFENAYRELDCIGFINDNQEV